MPMRLEGSCRCGAVRFALASHTPVPYQLCYCTICRKSAGGGGYAINLGGVMETLEVEGRAAVSAWHAMLGEGDAVHRSTAERSFCSRCGSPLWVHDPTWPHHVHPFASAIDTALPAAPARVHMMLDFRAPWVPLPDSAGDAHFARYPELSLEDWHKRHGVWVA